MKQPPVGKLGRKAVRKQARQEKNQRKAQNYMTQRAVSKGTKRQEWLQAHPQVIKKIQVAAETRSIKKISKRVEPFKKSHIFDADVIGDPLMAFAERAIDAGILGSDGEFDEAKMNDLFANEGVENFDEGEDISIGSDEEDYLNGNIEMEEDESVDIEADSDDQSITEGELTSKELISSKETHSKPKSETFGAQLLDKPVVNTDDNSKLQRELHGLVNKLTMSNFDNIASTVVEKFRIYPRYDVTEILTKSIMNSITKQANLLDSFIMTFASLTSAMAHLVGIDFVACILERCVLAIDEQRTLIKDPMQPTLSEIAPARIVMNCVTLLAYMYDLQVVANVTIVNLIQEAVDGMTELDVEILVKLIRTCGAQIRRDDAGSLKEIISNINLKALAIAEAQKSSRFNFMMETIQDLKNNRQKLVAVQHGELESAKKVLRNLLLRSNQSKLDPLQISLADIRHVKTRGKWWKIGAAWNPDGDRVVDDKEAAAEVLKKEWNSKFVELARQRGMNTDVRRAIFSALMASEDYMDAFYRLFSLKLPSRQEREIAHVLVHCCTHEKAFNPFYALVAGKFLESRHNFVITFKYAFWDRLKQVIGEEFKIKELVHVAKFFGFLLGRRALPLSILKRASFTQLSETVIIFLQILFVSFLESGRDDLQISLAVSELDDVKTREKRHNERENIDIFGGSEDDVVNGEGVNDEDELQQLKQQEMAALKTGLRIFFKQFMEKATELPTLSKPDLVQRRIGLVLSNLE